jgi:hypothetical protein
MARMWARALMAAGAAHDGQLVRVFHQAHFVQHAAQVALLLGAQRAVAHARAHLVASQPSTRASSPLWVANGYHTRRGFPAGLGSCGPARPRRRPRPRPALWRGLGAQAVAVPDLALQVLGLAKQRAAAVAVITSQALGSVKPVR